MDCCNAYESESMREALGDTLRPGGFFLTEKGMQFCDISAEDNVLDLGCGRGATVHYLFQTHSIRAVGIDPSEKLIQEAKKQHKGANFVLGRGEALPFADGSFQCVFAECTLSLMNTDLALRQVNRVLADGGWFVITDVYARNPADLGELEHFSVNSCMRGLHNLPLLQKKLEQEGFQIALSEDCSYFLKELLVKTVFLCGSMGTFWNTVSGGCMDGRKFQESLKKCKPGYFILIGRKAGPGHG